MQLNEENLKVLTGAFVALFGSLIEQKIEEALEQHRLNQPVVEQEPDRLLTRKQVAERFNCCPNTVSTWWQNSNGKIKNYGRGKKLLFKESELLAASLQKYVR